MLIEMNRRGIFPDLILFADTGGERPETYATVKKVSEWCVTHGMPDVTMVRTRGKELEKDCIDRKALPSIAYGFKTCSQRWKGSPQNIFCNNYALFKEFWKSGQRVIKAIGYDYGEERRAKIKEDEKYEYWYPLINWELDRESCASICLKEGLPIAKSSCFFCPSMKKWEIKDLAKNHPDLAARAIAMEKNAELTTIKGLGRNFAWGDFLAADSAQGDLFCDLSTPETPCGCYDG